MTTQKITFIAFDFDNITGKLAAWLVIEGDAYFTYRVYEIS